MSSFPNLGREDGAVAALLLTDLANLYVYTYSTYIPSIYIYNPPCNSGPDSGPWIFKGPLVAS